MLKITASIPAPQAQIKQTSEDISALSQDEFQTEMKNTAVITRAGTHRSCG